jgi:hypothetical protein
MRVPISVAVINTTPDVVEMLTQVYEVVDRNEDLLAIVQAVKEASRARLLH